VLVLAVGVDLAEVLIRVLLVFDALLDVLIVEVEFVDRVVGAEAGVVVGDDGFEGLFLFLGIVLVVFQFGRQIFLNLADVCADVAGRREDGGDVQRDKIRVGELAPALEGVKRARNTRWRR